MSDFFHFLRSRANKIMQIIIRIFQFGTFHLLQYSNLIQNSLRVLELSANGSELKLKRRLYSKQGVPASIIPSLSL